MKLISNMDNVEIYKLVKIQLQIYYIWGFTKIIKIRLIFTFWKFTLFPTIYDSFSYFCIADIIRYFELKFYKFVDLNIFHIYNKFQIFLEILKCFYFDFFKK
jgi:hypothetical protein